MSYTSSVAHGIRKATVEPTLSNSAASYIIRIHRGQAPGWGWVFVGSNVITVEVTAEDDSTTETYTVTVTRAAASTDATLSGLTLSSVDFGTFSSSTTSYTAEVDSSVTETTVTPTVNDSGANYVIKLGGEEDPDGTVALAAGSNVITVEVTAEDDSTTKTYTVTVTRLVTSQQNQASSDATLSSLTLSGIDFGTFSSDTDSYTASVAYGVSQTTVTPTVNDSGATHVIKLGGVEDADGVVSLNVGSNVITVEVTAEDGETTKTYTVGVNRAAASTDATLSGLTLSGIDFGTFTFGTTGRAGQGRHSAAAPGEAAERGAPWGPPKRPTGGARRRGDLSCPPGRATPVGGRHLPGLRRQGSSPRGAPLEDRPAGPGLRDLRRTGRPEGPCRCSSRRPGRRLLRSRIKDAGSMGPWSPGTQGEGRRRGAEVADLASVYSAAQQLRLSQENVATLVKALPAADTRTPTQRRRW